jgi:hypothetical protein
MANNNEKKTGERKKKQTQKKKSDRHGNANGGHAVEKRYKIRLGNYNLEPNNNKGNANIEVIFGTAYCYLEQIMVICKKCVIHSAMR